MNVHSIGNFFHLLLIFSMKWNERKKGRDRERPIKKENHTYTASEWLSERGKQSLS